MEKINAEDVASIIHAVTTNDVNGNPRRCYVLLDSQGETLAVADEGYLGAFAWHDLIRNDEHGTSGIHTVEPEPYRLVVTPKQYRELVKGTR